MSVFVLYNMVLYGADNCDVGWLGETNKGRNHNYERIEEDNESTKNSCQTRE